MSRKPWVPIGFFADARWQGYAAGAVGVGLMSMLIGLTPPLQRLANTSMLYLIVVLGVAVAFGRWPAVFASAVAFLVFDWLFVEPVHALSVASPEGWVVLVIFLITAVITGQLGAEQRQRAREAARREQEAALLYDVVRLMGRTNLNSALKAIAERLLQELQLEAIAVEIGDYGGVVAEAAAGNASAIEVIREARGSLAHVLGEGAPPTETQPGRAGTWTETVRPRLRETAGKGAAAPLHVVPVTVHGREVGNLLLVRAPGALEFAAADNRVLSAVASQIGLAVERLRLRQDATEAEVLRRTDEVKSVLLNAVSHDLRTPLASIIAAAGSLRQRDVAWSDEERYQLAEGIEEEAQRLNRLVGNLLDLSRIQGGGLRPQKAWHDLGSLIEDAMDRLGPLTAGHKVTVAVEESLPPACLDSVEIGQVIANLVENAAKYAPSGAEIELRAHRAGPEVQIEVLDRGPGIPPSDLPHLFEPFYRAGSTARLRGTGLGLAVAKGLIEAHDGRIWAENRPGGGARFVFTLPLGPGPTAAVAEEQVE